MDKIAVLIPCYNESLTIGKVIDDFKRVLPDSRIYVYDNNSTDDTWLVADNRDVIVRDAPIQGKGAVVRLMFSEVDAETYLIVDGDDTYPAEMAKELLDKLFEADMVLGDRLSGNYFNNNKRPFHGFGNKLVRWLVNVLYHGNISDVMTGYRAFSRKFVKDITLTSVGFEIETEMSIEALKHGYKIASIPICYKDRPRGSISKLRTYRDGIRVLWTIIRLKFKKER